MKIIIERIENYVRTVTKLIETNILKTRSLKMITIKRKKC